MSKEPTDVMIAADLTTDPAKDDHEAVTHAGVKLEGVILATCDHVGELHIEAEDPLARKGAEILGGAEVLELVQPEALAAPQGVAGAVVTRASQSAPNREARELSRHPEVMAANTVPCDAVAPFPARLRPPLG